MPYGGVECEKNSVEKPERLGAAYLSNLIDGRLITRLGSIHDSPAAGHVVEPSGQRRLPRCSFVLQRPKSANARPRAGNLWWATFTNALPSKTCAKHPSSHQKKQTQKRA